MQFNYYYMFSVGAAKIPIGINATIADLEGSEPLKFLLKTFLQKGLGYAIAKVIKIFFKKNAFIFIMILIISAPSFYLFRQISLMPEKIMDPNTISYLQKEELEDIYDEKKMSSVKEKQEIKKSTPPKIEKKTTEKIEKTNVKKIKSSREKKVAAENSTKKRDLYKKNPTKIHTPTRLNSFGTIENNESSSQISLPINQKEKIDISKSLIISSNSHKNNFGPKPNGSLGLIPDQSTKIEPFSIKNKKHINIPLINREISSSPFSVRKTKGAQNQEINIPDNRNTPVRKKNTEKQYHNIDGTILSQLNSCEDAFQEEILKKKILKIIGNKTFCANNSGEYYFLGTESLVSFNIIINNIYNRPFGSRCDELSNAFNCLKK